MFKLELHRPVSTCLSHVHLSDVKRTLPLVSDNEELQAIYAGNEPGPLGVRDRPRPIPVGASSPYTGGSLPNFGGRSSVFGCQKLSLQRIITAYSMFIFLIQFEFGWYVMNGKSDKYYFSVDEF